IAHLAPDAFIVNLETAITTCESPDLSKSIHYRTNPQHVGVLRAARIDACTLANNHVLDWSADGLRETLATLQAAGIAIAGAGLDAQQAGAPAVLPLPGGARLLLFAWATTSSGVPRDWAATPKRPGVSLLSGLDDAAARAVLRAVQPYRREGDRVVVSLHWGDNWVSQIPSAQRRFAHRLIELGAADVVHGHSSHHPLPPELHDGRLVLHGCGDLINDYEGIAARGELRSDVGCLYAVTISRSDGLLRALQIVPFQLRRFRLGELDGAARRWLHDLLVRGGAALEAIDDGPLRGSWRLALR
ncbi:MAG TPA: CapA family protein, partial [Burkholderiaceae bacterium]|nr:CapA family protein [Burkholderiaceae bacterium]